MSVSFSAYVTILSPLILWHHTLAKSSNNNSDDKVNTEHMFLGSVSFFFYFYFSSLHVSQNRQIEQQGVYSSQHWLYRTKCEIDDSMALFWAIHGTANDSPDFFPISIEQSTKQKIYLNNSRCWVGLYYQTIFRIAFTFSVEVSKSSEIIWRQQYG